MGPRTFAVVAIFALGFFLAYAAAGVYDGLTVWSSLARSTVVFGSAAIFVFLLIKCLSWAMDQDER